MESPFQNLRQGWSSDQDEGPVYPSILFLRPPISEEEQDVWEVLQ